MMPLPRLKVLRETYCSQQVVDTAVGWVESHRPELIEKLMEDEHWRQQDYSERAWDILEYLTEEKVEIPTSLVGRMDPPTDYGWHVPFHTPPQLSRRNDGLRKLGPDVWHWLPFVVLGWIWGGLFVGNMILKEASMSRYPEWTDYKSGSWWLLPPLL